jgi:S1-C subfamily serine protease
MSLDASQLGVLIEEVIPDTPADEAGLLGGDQATTIDGYQVLPGGDIIVAADGEPVDSMQALKAFLSEAEPGQNMEFSIVRGGTMATVDVVVGERPESMP